MSKTICTNAFYNKRAECRISFVKKNNAISKTNLGNIHAFWKLSLPIRNRIMTLSAVIVKR